MKMRYSLLLAALGAASFLLAGSGCGRKARPPVSLVDDGGGRTADDFPELAEDVFAAMDGGISLSEDEIKGRNTWNLWCGGNEQFWDRMARESFGLMDLLKTIDSRNRSSRFKELGLINQPGFRQSAAPDEHGLWIDEAAEPEPESIDPQVFGRPSGIMGIRLFDNPAFKGDAAKRWDGERYYEDADYAVGKDLVRPYQVGVSCGVCHIAFHPSNPPADPEAPEWENLASAIGNQYILEGKVFANNVREGGFFWEMLKNQPPGTSDTSRIATDHINNPNTINAIFELGARLKIGETEKLTGESLLLPTVKEEMATPHVLKDGADSVGVPGATLRVYINIGMYHQHFLQQHNALIGLSGQKPFSIATAQKNSVYWRATERKFENVAKFFMRLSSFRLADAPGGANYITTDSAVMERGKLVFAENCARCHSSKQPPGGADPDEWFRQEVMREDFLAGNFLSDDRRYPLTQIQTNAARASATNATRGHVWEMFSSETYKNLRPVGEIDVWNPYSGQDEKWNVPGGGPGYYRTASLISIWSSAPFLHNNALGEYTGDPSVAGRMKAFDDAMEKLLWPEKRLNRDSIWRTTQECNIQLQAAVIPEPLRTLLKSNTDNDGYFRLGPIPEGTPVNLLANVDPATEPRDLVALILKIKRALLEIKIRNLEGEAAREVMKEQVAPALMNANKCPDFITDRGHYFGTDLPDEDKRALIEFVKTF
ncbi:MAG TPA: hypothetical protein VMN36_16110 [Verrucomicrobiales bacterium]|nr:hypothetical protein [Verrucomicrobiales bacterium]